MDGGEGCIYRTGKAIAREEWEEMGMPTHIGLRTGTVFDEAAWRMPTERVPKYRVLDDELAWGGLHRGRMDEEFSGMAQKTILMDVGGRNQSDFSFYQTHHMKIN